MAPISFFMWRFYYKNHGVRYKSRNRDDCRWFFCGADGAEADGNAGGEGDQAVRADRSQRRGGCCGNTDACDEAADFWKPESRDAAYVGVAIGRDRSSAEDSGRGRWRSDQDFSTTIRDGCRRGTDFRRSLWRTLLLSRRWLALLARGLSNVAEGLPHGFPLAGRHCFAKAVLCALPAGFCRRQEFCSGGCQTVAAFAKVI